MPQALCGVSKRVCPVHDRRELAVFGEHGDGGQFSPFLPGRQEPKALADEPIDHCCPGHGAEGPDHLAGRATGVEHENPGRGQRPAQPAQRPVAHIVKDHVVAVRLAGEVVGGVVDDVRRAQLLKVSAAVVAERSQALPAEYAF